MIHAYAETPLPYFFSDKPHFFDMADYNNIARGFPICQNCYIDIELGAIFLDDRLDYNISALQLDEKKRKLKLSVSGIKFWLVPTLNNYGILRKFKDRLGGKRTYYIESLKEMCNSLESIQEIDVDTKEEVAEAFLRFSALFYSFDKNGKMRVLHVVHGIYPPQLRKLLQIKDKIDNLYPFKHIVERDEEANSSFGLPLLLLFYKGINAQWSTDVMEILNKMFTGKRISAKQIIKNINLRIRSVTRVSKDMHVISRIVFDGLMLLEYVSELNNGSAREKAPNIAMSDVSTYQTRCVQRFIESHKSLMVARNEYGVYGAGIAVAVFIDVQEDKYQKTAPYWNKISRLNLDLHKVINLIPDVRKGLAIYQRGKGTLSQKARNLEALVDYLIEAYPIDHKEYLQNDIVNYYFILGVSLGLRIMKNELRDSLENGEVKTE